MAPIFSLDDLQGQFQDNTAKSEERRQKELANAEKRRQLSDVANREAQQIELTARADRDESRSKQLKVLGGLDDQVSKANIAIALSDSDNPLDRLKLWMMQKSDDSYTSEGNLRHINYLNAAAASLGNRELINQTKYSEQLNQITNELELEMSGDENMLSVLKLRESQGQERIAAAAALLDTQRGMLQNQDAMQTSVLSNMNDEQVAGAMQQAVNSETGSINIGGVEVSAGLIQQRQDQLIERKYLTQMRGLAIKEMTLGDMTMPEVKAAQLEAANSKDGSTMVKNIQVSLARLNDREQQLLNQQASNISSQLGIIGAQESIANQMDKKYAATMTVPELNNAIINGGQVAEGHQIDLGILKNQRDLIAEAKVQEIDSKINGSELSDPLGTAVSHDKWLDSIRAPAGSPLERVIATQKTLTRAAASYMSPGPNGEPVDEFNVQLSRGALEASAATVDAAVKQEAKRLGAGDKDKELAYDYQLRGQQIPEAVVANAVQSEVTKGKHPGEWLSPAVAGEYIKVFNATKMQIKKDDLMNFKSDSIINGEAAAQALSAVKNKIAGGMTEELLSLQFEPSLSGLDNPLQGKVGAQLFLQITAESDRKGAARYQQVTNKSDEEMAPYLAGKEANPELAATQTGELLLELDKIEPGLSAQYVKWWGSQSRKELAQVYVQGKNSSADNFTSASELSLVLPDIPGDLTQYATQLVEGERRLNSVMLQEQHNEFLTFGGDEKVKQAYLLQADSGLTDSDKQNAMQFLIQPLIAEADQLKMEPAQRTMYIENQLRSRKFDSPSASKVQAKIMANREKSITGLEAMAQSAMLRQHGISGSSSGNSVMAKMANRFYSPDQAAAATSHYQWLTDMEGK